MGTVVIAVLAFLALSQGSPLPNRLKYDQKQEGKWNVRADLENFIILVIPTSSSSGSSSAANASLLDFISKTIPLPYHKFPKKHVKVHHQEEGSLPDTEQFIESKTAPYHVDISRTRSHLAKLHPEANIPNSVKEEIIIARSPSVALSKSQENALHHDRKHSLRRSRAILITVPVGNENVQMHDIKGVVGKMDHGMKKKLGLSAQAVEQGLAEQYEQNAPAKRWESLHFSEPLEDLTHKAQILIQQQEIAKKNSPAEYERLTQEVRTAYATIIAKAIQVNFADYLKKMAQKLKEQQEEADKNDSVESDLPDENEEDSEKKITHSSFTRKIVSIYDKLKEKIEAKKSAVPQTPNIELEPPKMDAPTKTKDEFAGKKVGNMEKPDKKPIGVNKEGPKDELLLLGAVNEQCGPGQERDSSGICVMVKS